MPASVGQMAVQGNRVQLMKSAEAQAQGMLLKMRELLVKQRTQLANALRGHAAEYGLVAAQGMSQVEPLLAALAADPAIPPLAKAVLARLGQQVAHLDAEIAALDAELLALHKAHPISRLLEGVPGIGRSPRSAWRWRSIPPSSPPGATSRLSSA